MIDEAVSFFRYTLEFALIDTEEIYDTDQYEKFGMI